MRIRARSFSRQNGEGGDKALREMEGDVLVVLIPMPTTDKYSEEE